MKKPGFVLLGAANAAGFSATVAKKLFSWSDSKGRAQQREISVIVLSPRFGLAKDFSTQSDAISFCRGVIWARENKP